MGETAGGGGCGRGADGRRVILLGNCLSNFQLPLILNFHRFLYFFIKLGKKTILVKIYPWICVNDSIKDLRDKFSLQSYKLGEQNWRGRVKNLKRKSKEKKRKNMFLPNNRHTLRFIVSNFKISRLSQNK